MSIFADFLLTHLPQQTASIQSYVIELNQTDQNNLTSSVQNEESKKVKVWLKKASERHSTWIYLPIKLLAKLFRLEVLLPVPNYGGSHAIQCEYKRIQQLNKIGVRTSTVLAVSDYGILLEDAAPPGEEVIQLDTALARCETLEKKLSLYIKSIEKISSIHQKQGYLSEGFIRNILVDSSEDFIFIDFETDPAEVLPLEICQTRDWLCFIFSSAYYFDFDQLPTASKAFYNIVKNEPKAYSKICRLGRKLRWVLPLRPQIVGNDGKRIEKTILFLKYLDQASKQA